MHARTTRSVTNRWDAMAEFASVLGKLSMEMPAGENAASRLATLYVNDLWGEIGARGKAGVIGA